MLNLNQMALYQSKSFKIYGISFAVIFIVLFSVRLGFFEASSPKINDIPVSSVTSMSEKNSWMNIMQSGKKIGFSHSSLVKSEEKYKIEETVFMRINTMGMIQDINLETKGVLYSDFSLNSIEFAIKSGRFDFHAKGQVSGEILSVVTVSSGDERKFDIKLKNKPYLVAGIMDAVYALGLDKPKTMKFDIFDPATMGQEAVIVTVFGKEKVVIGDKDYPSTKVSIEFKGISQFAWLSESGDVLKETGMLGISLEKTTREDALEGIAVESSDDLTLLAAVKSNVQFSNPSELNRLVVKLSGIDIKKVSLSIGRQSLDGNVLTIAKEKIDPNAAQDQKQLETLSQFLQPEPFIESDHPKILEIVHSLILEEDTPFLKIQKLKNWVYVNIQKRPVLSLPDALSTLENRIGDCNEHSVLMAALVRAAGIPAQVEAGLVFINGQFFYHAWNSVFIGGEWITVDALLGQFPADVTHIRFSTGTKQLDLMNIIGQIEIEVIEPKQEP